MPLALTIVAAQTASNPRFPLASAAAELRQAGAILDQFRSGDPATDVRAVFSWSDRALSRGAARLFRFLGLHPGTDITVPAAASLTGIPVPQAGSQLAELCRAHLLAEHRPGRYTCHDLLRAYAAEQARRHDSQEARDAAGQRLFDHYLQTAHAAATLIEPYLVPFAPAQPATGVVGAELGSAEQALDWFGAEHATLLTIVQLAAGLGSEVRAWQLAWTLTSFQLRRGLWQDHAAAQQAGLRAARRAGDLAGEAHALLAQALGYSRSGRFDDAETLFLQALRILEASGTYLASQGMIHTGLTWLCERKQRRSDTVRHAARALDLYTAAGNQPLQVMALNDLGYSHALAGNYRQALSSCRQALAAIQQLGEPLWESAAWHSLGYIHAEVGETQEAIDCYQRSLDLTRALTDRYNEADTLRCIGDVHHGAGNLAAASRAWTQALCIFTELDHPDAHLVRARLRLRDRPLPASLAGPPLDHQVDHQVQDRARERTRVC